MAEKLCLEVRDITVMSEQVDFFRLFEKPRYEGDFLRQMFDWNLNQEAEEHEHALVIEGLAGTAVDGESWEDFQTTLVEVKYQAKH